MTPGRRAGAGEGGLGAAGRRVALVTGGNRGIGLEICRQLADHGLHVVLTARDATMGREAAAALGGDERGVRFHALDVTDPEGVRGVAAWTDATLGGVDVLVNNAGVLLGEDVGVLDAPIDAYRASMETNVYGPLRLCQALVPGMRTRRYGRVVNVSSGAGQLGSMGGYAPPYSLSKAALNALTRQVAHAARGTNVLVNAADPGWVRTDMGGRGAPRTVARGADTAVWLATLPDGGPTGGFFHDRRAVPW